VLKLPSVGNVGNSNVGKPFIVISSVEYKPVIDVIC
jgi:hypothetical protein